MLQHAVAAAAAAALLARKLLLLTLLILCKNRRQPQMEIDTNKLNMEWQREIHANISPKHWHCLRRIFHSFTIVSDVFLSSTVALSLDSTMGKTFQSFAKGFSLLNVVLDLN